MCILRAKGAVLAAAVAMVMPTMAVAQQWEYPMIRNYGAVHPIPNAGEQPDRAHPYKVVFDVKKAATTASKVNPGLDHIARFVNLLALAGMRADGAKLVAIIHGPATEAVMTGDAYRAKHDGQANPNLDLIRQLREQGVEVHVCGQALAEHDIDSKNVVQGVQIDLSALTTLANLQLRGYALIPD